MDPVEILINRLRSDRDLDFVLDVWGHAPWPRKRAVFRTSMEPNYKVTDEPSIIVDPASERPGTHKHFKGESRLAVVDLRIFALIAREGDYALSTASVAVKNSLHRKVWPVEGGRLIGVSVDGPQPTPASVPKIGGRRLSVTMTFEESH